MKEITLEDVKIIEKKIKTKTIECQTARTTLSAQLAPLKKEDASCPAQQGIQAAPDQTLKTIENLITDLNDFLDYATHPKSPVNRCITELIKTDLQSPQDQDAAVLPEYDDSDPIFDDHELDKLYQKFLNAKLCIQLNIDQKKSTSSEKHPNVPFIVITRIPDNANEAKIKSNTEPQHPTKAHLTVPLFPSKSKKSQHKHPPKKMEPFPQDDNKEGKLNNVTTTAVTQVRLKKKPRPTKTSDTFGNRDGYQTDHEEEASSSDEESAKPTFK